MHVLLRDGWVHARRRRRGIDFWMCEEGSSPLSFQPPGDMRGAVSGSGIGIGRGTEYARARRPRVGGLVCGGCGRSVLHPPHPFARFLFFSYVLLINIPCSLGLAVLCLIAAVMLTDVQSRQRRVRCDQSRLVRFLSSFLHSFSFPNPHSAALLANRSTQ